MTDYDNKIMPPTGSELNSGMSTGYKPKEIPKPESVKKPAEKPIGKSFKEMLEDLINKDKGQHNQN